MKDKTIFKLVELGLSPETIIAKAGYDIKKVKTGCFESASYVFVLKDRKTCVEVCFAPEMIHTWEDRNNPLFKKERSRPKLF